MLETRHLHAGYDARTVLRDVSLTFERGTLTAVIGLNGCGKSTLLKTLLGILPTKSGEVVLDGTPLTTLKPTAVARKLAYLSQGGAIPAMTVGQLVLHGRFAHLHYPRRYRESDRTAAKAAMAQLGITELADAPLSTLSGGTRQKAYLAMALASEADYFLLDEPATYLDVPHQLDLMHRLTALKHDGKGIVAVMHDLPMALTFADRVVLIDNGTIIADDTPESLCATGILDTTFGVTIKHTDNTYHLHLK